MSGEISSERPPPRKNILSEFGVGHSKSDRDDVEEVMAGSSAFFAAFDELNP